MLGKTGAKREFHCWGVCITNDDEKPLVRLKGVSTLNVLIVPRLLVCLPYYHKKTTKSLLHELMGLLSELCYKVHSEGNSYTKHNCLNYSNY